MTKLSHLLIIISIVISFSNVHCSSLEVNYESLSLSQELLSGIHILPHLDLNKKQQQQQHTALQIRKGLLTHSSSSN